MADTSTRSPACHFRYHDKLSGDILLQDVYVPASGDQPYTFYCCLEWNIGQNCQGYLGIQDHGQGNRSYIYSLWDPLDQTVPLSKAVYKAPGSEVTRFSSEGNGIHMRNHATGWDPDSWYTMATRCWEQDGHTHLGFWTHNQSSKIWTHQVTFDYPVSRITFNAVTDCFLENFHGSGRPVRSVRYGHGYKRGLDKTWFPFTSAHLHVNRGEIVKDWENNFNAGVNYGYFYVETGQGIHPQGGIKADDDLEITLPSLPIKPPIEFVITRSSPGIVQWNMPDTCTPQFSYTIVVDERQLVSEVGPKVRSYAIGGAHWGSVVKITLEDILGNVVSNTANIGN